MKKHLSLAAVALSFLLVQAPAAFADSHDTWDQSKKVNKIAEKLSLTAEQKTKIKDIIKKASDDIKPKKDELKKISKEIDQDFKSNTLTESKIDSYVDQKQPLIGEIMKIRLTERLQISQVLTDAQKAKWNQWHKSEWKKK